jgi:hypothetical protein
MWFATALPSSPAASASLPLRPHVNTALHALLSPPPLLRFPEMERLGDECRRKRHSAVSSSRSPSIRRLRTPLPSFLSTQLPLSAWAYEESVRMSCAVWRRTALSGTSRIDARRDGAAAFRSPVRTVVAGKEGGRAGGGMPSRCASATHLASPPVRSILISLGRLVSVGPSSMPVILSPTRTALRGRHPQCM